MEPETFATERDAMLYAKELVSSTGREGGVVVIWQVDELFTVLPENVSPFDAGFDFARRIAHVHKSDQAGPPKTDDLVELPHSLY